jgi:hypothetical protein
MIEACARQALCAPKIIHNFRDLLPESRGWRQENLRGLHVAVVVVSDLEYHPRVAFHDHADRLIQMVEIRAANIAGRQTPMQFVPRHARNRGQDARRGSRARLATCAANRP